ncbi:hypothetical protein V8E36_000118 [Tilletia maclaganii]
MGNGNRAAQKRERNAKDATKEPKSQLKLNEAAKNVKCSVCFQTFLSTVRGPALQQHAEKHSKDMSTCFPGWTAN